MVPSFERRSHSLYRVQRTASLAGTVNTGATCDIVVGREQDRA